MFTDRGDALAFIMNNLPATRGKIRTEDQVLLAQLLDGATGTDASSIVYYRAYYVAGRFLELHPSFLLERKDVDEHYSASFKNQEKQIETLFELQNAEDQILGLTVADSSKTHVSKSAFSGGRQAWTESRKSTTNSVGNLEDNIFGYL